ncbi:dolichol-phosphate mannosyltransferase subunit 3 [Marchantia polymorpha subsp. ruderalis]|uniref:Dolichol-phosphate mannosyltransferase subunit 3 n=2 Tax=Marchantia polymorpha TaxID=3197 RepID=A0A176VHZ9_MARPO|nr:hypothetical protein AXG93_517s1010 [Marchantia polymorpha subsp. ruderalis]PTQ37388.1 hypothetical protein MARPO_0057s0028 [Marchantia polymorpha]BBN16452.1 hypothetical protein Mp_7g06420 [Marchantia polymorpha subsp. ruderalis]|eukprot:PTQ37388.1 hypothetical protein MARPO_0057s0028 [Marchantia polymorpha]
MKQVFKFGAVVGTLVALWIGLLLSPDLPQSFSLILPFLPVYALVALGCYGLGMVGYGLMVFPTCPHESILLQKDIDEAKAFLKEKGVDVAYQ